MDKRLGSARQGSGWSVLFPLALIIALGLVLPPWLGILVKSPGGGLALTWLVIAILMLSIIAIVGVSLGKGPMGILIDNRNMMSLSRLQIVVWTMVVLSAFVTVALARVNDSGVNPDGYVPAVEESAEGQAKQQPERADPLGIRLPPLLWVLMGISVTSAVASPLLTAAKAQRTSEEDFRRGVRGPTDKIPTTPTYRGAFENAKSAIPQDERVSENEGAVVKKASWTDAKFSDVFMGEEATNFMYVDVGKVQSFFFTMVAVVAYTVALAAAMSTAASIADFFAFPELPAGLIAVISISHGGYLTDTAFTHTTPAVPAP